MRARTLLMIATATLALAACGTSSGGDGAADTGATTDTGGGDVSLDTVDQDSGVDAGVDAGDDVAPDGGEDIGADAGDASEDPGPDAAPDAASDADAADASSGECSSNDDCGATEYCEGEVGACGIGFCVERPVACPDVYIPVCGCDGVTYGNACDAAGAGASVSYEGVCEVIARCADNGDCSRSQYCASPEGVCGAGECAVRPSECPAIESPVCGCNAQTYSNACVAASAGVSVASDGACAAGACRTDADCGRGGYCESDLGVCGAGTCATPPTSCPDVYVPVCGCNGLTYGNACEAAAARASIAAEGACAPVDTCVANAECSRSEYCQSDVGVCGEGTCTPVPDTCPRIFDPVCGCDGADYSNDCFAGLARVSVAYAGECRTTSGCFNTGDCARGDVCIQPEGACAAEGTCEPRPDICPLVIDPVCGCDGNTYVNSCEAYVAGVSVAASGECDAPTDICRSDVDCLGDEYCNFSFDGACMRTGICDPRPSGCPAVYIPVCGCDGRTYGNACNAAAAGASVASDGECTAP